MRENWPLKHKVYHSVDELQTDFEEWLVREIFYTLREAQILIEDWKRKYNTIRPHSALNYRPPELGAILVPLIVVVHRQRQ